jgi:hypothetical protein
MTNARPSVAPVLHDIHVNVVSAEEASLGVDGQPPPRPSTEPTKGMK